MQPDSPRHRPLPVRDVLAFLGALLAIALCVHLGSSALIHALSPITLALVESALLMILALLVAWNMYRAGIGEMSSQTASDQSESPHRLVRWAFVSTMLVLATALLVGTCAQREVTTYAASAARLMNTASRQGMLSQVIAREAASPAHRRNRDRLSAAITRMNTEATKLRAAIHAINTKHPDSLRPLQNQLQEAERHRAPMVAAATVLARGEPGSEGVASVVLTNADLFLPQMEQSVAALQALSESDVSTVQLGAFATLLTSLLLFVIVGVVVIEPIVRLVKRQHLRAGRRSAELEMMSMAAQRTSNAVVFTDANRKITWVNRSFTRITGYSLAEAIGQPPGALLQCALTDPVMSAAMRAALNAGQPFRGTILNCAKSGREFWLDIDIQPIRDIDGVLTGFSAIETDVTEQVAERDRLTCIFETLTEGVVLVGADGAFLEWNDAAERILGLTGAQLEGRDVIDSRWSSVDQDGLPLSAADVPVMVTLRTGAPCRGLVHGISLPDGTRRWISVSTEAIRGPDGSIASVVASFSDITAKRSQEQDNALIVNAAGLGTWDWHVPSGEVLFNGRVGAMLGFQPGEFTDRLESWAERIHPVDKDRTWEAVAAALDGSVPEYRCEHRLLRKDGTWAWMIGAGRATERSIDGETLRMSGVLVDISAAKESELLVRVTQERFQAAVAGTSDGLWDWDVHSDEIWLSPRCWVLLGYPETGPYPAVTLALFRERLHPEDRVHTLGALDAILADDIPCDEELRLQLLSGDYRWFRLRCAAQRDSAGAAARLAGSIQDVTAARNAENALRHARQEAEDALREIAALRTALDEHSILSVANRAGQIVDVNSGFCQISGYSREELVGLDHRLLNSGVHPKAFWFDVWRIIASGRAWRGEVCNRRNDGSLYWVDSTIVPYMNNDWEVEKYVSIGFDISTQKAAEAELQRASMMLEEAQSVARIGNWSYDLMTGRIEWSRQIYALFGRDEAIGPPDYQTAVSDFDDEHSILIQAAIAHTAATGEPYSLVLRTRAQHKGVRFVRTIGQVRKSDAGSVTGLYGTVADVTAEIERGAELQRAQREAEAAGEQLREMNTFLEGETVRANDMAARAELASHTKSEFLANMSHEIRTPLTAILGYTDILAEEVAVDDESTRRVATLQTIRRAGEHLLTVINDVLDLSKIESGRLLVERVETDLPRIMLDVDSLMRSRAAAKGVALHSAFASAVPNRIWSDPTRLRQILLNLVGNAVKFTREGRIDVSAAVVQVEHRDAPMLRVEVRDTGPGMTRAQSTQLFQPFHQGDASVTREHGGTGLGLTICRRLARLMGGDVRLEFSEPGRGSCFVLEIPLEPHDEAQLVHCLTDSTTTTAQPTPTGGVMQTPLRGRVLLAEDGEDNQRLIVFHLERAGAQVTVVANGQLALDAIDAANAAGQPYGLVVTDMQMPVMDGYTLARTLRARKSTMPVIALTAHAMAEDRQRCLDAGCDDYATKPIEKKLLIAACVRWMGVVRTLVPDDDGAVGDDFLDFEQSDEFSRETVGAALSPLDLPCDADESVLISELLDDPDMFPLVQGFLLLLAERIALIEQQRELGQRAELTSLAHRLKGAAGGYGFPTITEAARTVERYAAAGGTQREVDDAIAALGATCRAALRGGGAPADTQSGTASTQVINANGHEP